MFVGLVRPADLAANRRQPQTAYHRPPYRFMDRPVSACPGSVAAMSEGAQGMNLAGVEAVARG